MPGIKPTSLLFPFECGNCDNILSHRCADCERVYRARQATIDSLAPDETNGWIEADLYPPN